MHTQNEPLEINLQERPAQIPNDESLPAAQVIEEQNDEAAHQHAPRFLP